MKRLFLTLILISCLALSVSPVSAQQGVATFYIYDEYQSPMSNVQVSIYNSNAAAEIGSLYAKVTISHGGQQTLPEGFYVCKGEKAGYEMAFPIQDTRLYVTQGAGNCVINMRSVSAPPDPQLMPIVIYPYDASTSEELTSVQVTAYKWSNGQLIDSGTFSYGSSWYLPIDYYYFSAYKDGYFQKYAPIDTRGQNVDSGGGSFGSVQIPMDKVIPSDAVTFRPYETGTQAQLNAVTIRVYEANQDMSIGNFVSTHTVSYNSVINLDPGKYFVAAFKENYIQEYSLIDTRIDNTAGTVTCLIPMATYSDPTISGLTEEYNHTFVGGLPSDWNVTGYPADEYSYGANKFLELWTFPGNDILRSVSAYQTTAIDTPAQIHFKIRPYTTSAYCGFGGSISAFTSGTGVFQGQSAILIEVDRDTRIATVKIVSSGGGTLYEWKESVLRLGNTVPYDVYVRVLPDGTLLTKFENQPWKTHSYKHTMSNLYPFVGTTTQSTNMKTMYCTGVTVSRATSVQEAYDVTLNIRDSITDDLIPGAAITIYTCDPSTFQPIAVYDTVTATTGTYVFDDTNDGGYYCVAVSASGYTQMYSISETRFLNFNGEVILNIRMIPDEIPPDTYPVTFRPVVVDDQAPLNDVSINIYRLEPGTSQVKELISSHTVNYDTILNLPPGYYGVEATKTGYMQVYPISDTRINTMLGSAVTVTIPMEPTAMDVHPVRLHLQDYDTKESLNGVRVKIYRANIDEWSIGELVYNDIVDDGESVMLSPGYYFVEAFKAGYKQTQIVTDQRISVQPPHVGASIIYLTKTAPGAGDDLGFIERAKQSIADLFGVSYDIGGTLLGLFIAFGIGSATAKQLRGGALEFSAGVLAGLAITSVLGITPIWIFVVFLLLAGLLIGFRYFKTGVGG